jgi:membrane protein
VPYGDDLTSVDPVHALSVDANEIIVVGTVWALIKRSTIKWNDDDCLTLGAALAYYTVFSLAPVLVIVIAVASALFGEEAAQGEIIGQIRSLVGDEGAIAIQALIRSVSRRGVGPVAALVGLIVLLLGATSAFSQLQSALNRVWEVPPQTHLGISQLVRARLFSFAAVLGAGFLLSVSLALSAATVALGPYRFGWLPQVGGMLEMADLVGSILVHTLVFALIFKLLPDVPVEWRDVWVGAMVTAGLFFIGKIAIGFYLGTTELGAAYGAARWVILGLVWVYYTAQIVLFGAEFTHVYATRATIAAERSRHAHA